MCHYKFKQYIRTKSEEYDCKVHDVTEEYTSKTCTYCGHLGDVFVEREKHCNNCKKTIDRDINGARNILLKNIHPLIQ